MLTKRMASNTVPAPIAACARKSMSARSIPGANSSERVEALREVSRNGLDVRDMAISDSFKIPTLSWSAREGWGTRLTAPELRRAFGLGLRRSLRERQPD